MTVRSTRPVAEGVGFGLIAGVLFALMQVAGSAFLNNTPLMPLRLFASIILGTEALGASPLGSTILVGAIVHLLLSAIFGVIYAGMNARFSVETRTSWTRQVGLGLLVGAVLWLVNFQFIARAIYPWFLTTPQLLQLLMHAMFFGLPLALMFAAAERQSEPAAMSRSWR